MLTYIFFVNTINWIDYEFDLNKDESNLDKHGVSLVDAHNFEWDTALVREDKRKPYAEPCFEAKGYIGNRLYMMAFCLRASTVRVIE
jgi:uncharacterized DUF497 family protein